MGTNVTLANRKNTFTWGTPNQVCLLTNLYHNANTTSYIYDCLPTNANISVVNAANLNCSI